jgi:hypothetical protein
MKPIKLNDDERVGACVPYVTDHGYALIDVFILHWPSNKFRCVTIRTDDCDDDTKTLFKAAACLSKEFLNTILFSRAS